MKKIRKGDNVIVISGRDKGRKGAVLAVLENETVLVENVNRVKRHTRGNPQMNKAGGILETLQAGDRDRAMADLERGAYMLAAIKLRGCLARLFVATSNS